MDWKNFLEEEKQKEYMKKIIKKVSYERKKTIIYPPDEKVFRIFDISHGKNVNVVILGMDPYINYKQANGVSFGVENLYNMPPSLKNIFKVSNSEKQDRTLLSWAEQGVFLLNTILTVEAGNSGSHQKFGWQEFTQKVIKKISDEQENVVFMLWGKISQESEKIINSNNHLILKATHPSPLGCRRKGTSCGDPFMECDHFNKANEYLKKNGKKEILW